MLDRRRLLATTAAMAVAKPVAVADGSIVDLQLVLAIDVSGSVTAARFHLQRDGYTAAFRSKEVQAAIARTSAGAIALAMTQWTGPSLQRIVIPWTRVSTAASCNTFADVIAAGPRQLFSGGTSISGAIDHALSLFPACPFKGARSLPPRKIIDVSGDGRNNRGRPAPEARDDGVAADVIINGLPILALEADLDAYYRDHVIGGPGAFSMPAASYDTMADAVRRKLVQEIA